MAATVAVKTSHIPGDKKRVAFTQTFDASYPTGGYPLPTAQQLGLNQITDITFGGFNAAASAAALPASDYTVNKSTSKIQLVTPAAVEVTAATDVHLFSVDGVAEGY